MDVQATLLYRTLRPVDIDALVETVNSWINFDALKMTHSPQAGDHNILLTNPNFHAVLTINKSQLDFTTIESALNAPILAIKDFDYADALNAHKMHVTIKVGDGPLALTAEMRQWMDRMGKHQTQTECPLDQKLAVLNGLVQVLCGHDVPELVHWSQSDMIFTPDEVFEAGDMLFPLPLVVRPTPIWSSSDQSQNAGVRLEYSEMFAGRTLVMEPSDLPVAQTLGIVMWLLSQKAEGQMALEHAGVLETPGFPTFHFRHEMGDRHDPKGRIIVTQQPPEQYTMNAGPTRPVVSYSAPPSSTPVVQQGTQAYAPAPSQFVAPQVQAPQAEAPQVQAPAAPAPQPQAVFAPAPIAQAAVAPAPVAQAPAPQVQASAPAAAPTGAKAVEPAANGSLEGLAQAAQTKEQPAPAQPTPAPAAPAPAPEAKGFANASHQTARSYEEKARANNFASQGGLTAKPLAAPAKPAPDAGLMEHHEVDAAAGLLKQMNEKAKATQDAALAANTPEAPKGLLSRLNARALTGAVAMFLLVAAGLTIAPKLINNGTDVAASETKRTSGPLLIDAGPRLPGQPLD